MATTYEMGFINVPISPNFVGIAGKLNDQLIKPARDAGKKAATEVEKSVEASVKSLERQVAASTKKLGDLDRAHQDSMSKREAQQGKLNAAIAEQSAAEEKYQQALKKGNSGLAELAKVEKAKAKVTDETLKLAKAERDITDAEQKHKAQLEDLQRTTSKYEKAQADLNAEVGKSKDVFGGIRNSVSGLKDQVLEMPGPLGGIGDVLSSFKDGPTAGVMAVAGAFTAAVGAVGKFNEDLTQSRVSMQNQFGLSADAARDMQGEIADALGSGMGDYEETALAVTQINQVLGDEIAHMGGQTAAQLSDDFMAFNATFARSAEETASTIDVMLNSGMVSNAQEGLDLLTAGMQKVPAAMQDEVFDAMNEYSKHFNTLGIDGADAMAMLVAASENGQYAIDKTGDAIKEFSLRGSDMSKTSTEAYDLIGLSAEEMASKIAAGGEGAQEALNRTAEGLLGIEDPAERANAAIALFGTPVEDLGVDQIPAFLESLTAGGEGMGDFAGSAQTMADNTQSTFTGMFNQLKGQVHGWAIDSMITLNEWSGEVAQAVIDSPIVESVGDTLGSIKELGSGVWDILFEGDYTGLPFGLSEDSGVVDFLFDIREGAIETKDTVINAWDEIAAAFTGGDWGYGALAQRFGEDGAESLITIVADLGERIFEFRDKIVEFFHDVQDTAEPVLTWLSDFIEDQLGETLSSLWETVQSLAEAWLDMAGVIGGALLEVLSSAWEILKSLWDLISPVLIPVLKVLGGIIGGVLVAAFVGLVGAVRAASEIIEAFAEIISWTMSNILAPLISIIGDLIGWIGDRLAGTISAFGELWSNIWAGVSSVWDGFTTLLGIGVDFIVATVFGGLGAGLDVLRDSFGTAVDAISKIWDGLRQAAMAPVKFVVDTVWNNGLVKAINAVTKFIGMDEIQPIQIGFASGGILPGYSRMADGDDQLVPMRRGEGVLVSEGLQDPVSRELFLAANEEAKRGKSFAKFLEDYVAGYANGGIVGSMQSIMREFYPELQLTSHFRPGDSGYHGKNMAGDFSNTGAGMPSTPAMQAAAKFMFGNYGDQLEQLIHHPARNIGSGRDVGDGMSYYGAATMAGHTDHIHLAALKPLVDPSGVVQMVPFDGESGGGFSIMGTIKRLWDGIVNNIMPYGDEGAGWFSQIPGQFVKSASEKLWEFVTGKVGSGSYDGAGGISGDVESWREMAMAAMRRNGFDADNPAQVNAMLKQIQSESGGNPSIKQGIIDVNSGGNEAMGLLQIIPGTFEAHRDPSLPNDRTDPWANMNAALRYYRSRYGDDLTTMWGHGHGYAEGGIVDLFTRDLGGWVPDGALVRNTSGRDELMLPPELSQAMAGFFSNYPDAAKMLADAAVSIESASESLAKVADRDSTEGMVARAIFTEVGGIFGTLGLDGTATVMGSLIDAETELAEARSGHADRLAEVAEKEKAYAEALEALQKLQSESVEMAVEDKRKLADAEKALAEAKEPNSKGEVDSDKVADAEEKLARVREDLAAKGVKDEEKRAEEVEKATQQVAKAESELTEARRKSVQALDMTIYDLAPQVHDLAVQGAAAAGNAGLGGVADALSGVAAMAGPAGMSVGVAIQGLKTAIGLVQKIVGVIKDFVEKLFQARLSALKALSDAWSTVAEYASLMVKMQSNVVELQQSLVRSATEMRTAEFNLRVAVSDRLIAQLDGEVKLAEARQKLDDEVKRGALAAQLKLMGLHEDWDSYMSFQAAVGEGVLAQWSDAAISALFEYESARATALKGELEARLNQIKAEAALAEATRTNLRNQEDLLVAQERLISMSAKVAGVDLEDATGAASVAKLMVELAEARKAADTNIFGRAGAFLGFSGPKSMEYRGQQAKVESLQAALDSVIAETGVNVDQGKLDSTLKKMAAVDFLGGDALAVLRAEMPELAAAETALKINEALSPVWEVRDQKTQLDRSVEDFNAEIDLYEKTQPLTEAIKGLEYTISSLDASAKAFAEGNEQVRGEYLASAAAKADAARTFGVDWQLDSSVVSGSVRDQIVKEVTINMNGDSFYSADEVDQLLSEVVSGSNVRVVTKIAPSTLARSRRVEVTS